MTFPSWCEYQAHDTRLRLRETFEAQLDAALAYDALAATIPECPTPKRACVNHPHKWAQDGDLCRTCIRAAGDQRTTRQIQADGRARSTNIAVSHRKPDLDDLDHVSA